MIWKTGFWLGVLLAWCTTIAVVGSLARAIEESHGLLLAFGFFAPMLILWCIGVVVLMVKFFSELDNFAKTW